MSSHPAATLKLSPTLMPYCRPVHDRPAGDMSAGRGVNWQVQYSMARRVQATTISADNEKQTANHCATSVLHKIPENQLANFDSIRKDSI